MVLSPDLVQRVAQRGQKILVRLKHAPVKAELDHRLRLADRRHLALVIRRRQLLLGDIGGVFHHLDGLAVLVEHRVVAGLDPDLTPAFADPLVLPRFELAPPEPVPERAIVKTLPLHGIDEHRMMLTADLVQRVAHQGQKIRIRAENPAIKPKLDHSLRAIDGRQPCLVIPDFEPLPCDL